jgi:enoyl-CoA hydratase/carnithine racemase
MTTATGLPLSFPAFTRRSSNETRPTRAGYQARHFGYSVTGKVATITLNRPDRKNPLTFDSYGELRDLFREMCYATDVKAVVFTGEGGNFCSGGDVHEIIGPLVKMDMPELLEFTRMTGDLVKAMRACPQPIIAAIDGVCTGAGAMIACGSDLRLATARSKLAFLFVRVGLAGADMGACTLLPRLIGLSRAADLLYTGRVVGGDEAASAGLLQPPGRARAAAGRGAGAGAEPGRRADLRPCDDQDHAVAGMELGPGRVHRGRGAGAGHLHADPGLRARLPRLRRQDQARLRGQLTMATPADLAWPFFDDGHRALVPRFEGWAADELPRCCTVPRTAWTPCTPACAAGAFTGPGRVAAGVRAGRLCGGLREQLDVRSLSAGRETLAHHSGWRISPWRCRAWAARR